MKYKVSIMNRCSVLKIIFTLFAGLFLYMFFGSIVLAFDSASGNVIVLANNDGNLTGEERGWSSKGIDVEPFENIADVEVQYIMAVSPGKDVVIQFKKPVHSILEIKFVYSQNADEISVAVEKLINSSALANGSPAGVMYENDNIQVNAPGQSYISNVTIKFRVEKAWISSKSINPDSISLFRYGMGAWNKLATERLFENESIIIYMANTPGFSPFAITGEKLQPVSTSTIAPTPADTPDSGPASMPLSEPSVSLLLNCVYIAVLMGGFVGFAVVTFLYFYTKPKNQ